MLELCEEEFRKSVRGPEAKIFGIPTAIKLMYVQ